MVGWPALISAGLLSTMLSLQYRAQIASFAAWAVSDVHVALKVRAPHDIVHAHACTCTRMYIRVRFRGARIPGRGARNTHTPQYAHGARNAYTHMA